MNTVISPVNTKDRASLGVKSGDTVRVWVKIQEKDKTKLQVFEGLVLSVKHGSEAGATFTVRRTTRGVGVEKIFPLYSPMIDKIEITKRAKVRRSKLYHIREKAMKDVRRQMRNAKIVDISTSNEVKDDSTKEIVTEGADTTSEKTNADKAEAEAQKERQQEVKESTEKKEEEKSE